jgi:hypothetical protein
MKTTKTTIITALLIATATFANGQVITFEPDSNGCLPDGSTAVDDMIITNQFLRYGVLFGIDNDLNGIPDTNAWAYLEKTGDDGDNGFQNRYGIFDTAMDGYSNQLGNYFLRTIAVDPDNEQQVLLVSYTTPVDKASAEIWDLDANFSGSNPDYHGEEQWKIEALDENQQVITNLLSPIGIDWGSSDTLDGLPWSFEIDAEDEKMIAALRISFTGNRESYVGIAFNNFSPADGLGTTNVIGVAEVSPSVEISWHSKLGRTYQLQWSQNLGKEWHNLGAALEGTGTELTAFDSSRNAKNRVYRVLETY